MEPTKQEFKRAVALGHGEIVRAYQRTSFSAQTRKACERSSRHYHATVDKLLADPFKWPEINLGKIKTRANAKGIPFDLTVDDLREAMPADLICPILAKPFVFTRGLHPMTPSVDRIRPSLGYVRGNIAVISALANRLKSDCTDPAVFRRLADWLGTISYD